MKPSLCEFCLPMKEVISGKGTRFVLCQKSSLEKRFPKYPPQPVIQCDGFDVQDSSEGAAE
ncbi:MAG TPA: hypothetical protein DD473_19300 [Planctomycetaceae bacterium]|nr:hypothetical protein [Planctomycetaceae bacterium]